MNSLPQEMAERVLNNLQKGIVDSTISVAAGLEKGGSYSAIHQALPYYESPSHLRWQKLTLLHKKKTQP
jgi:hypothetical protein